MHVTDLISCAAPGGALEHSGLGSGVRGCQIVIPGRDPVFFSLLQFCRCRVWLSFCCFLLREPGAYVASEQGADEENAQALKTADSGQRTAEGGGA